jgi:2-phospho-L-lactate transferase/gluconeogenesis factor (CofD/UPF0052 family)
MTEVGESDNYSASDHVRALIKQTDHRILNYCVANTTRIPKNLYERYSLRGQYPVKLDDKDEKWFKKEKITLVKSHIASTEEFVRHDSMKLSEVILNILSHEKKK